MAAVITYATVFQAFFSGVGQVESVIEFSACQQSRV